MMWGGVADMVGVVEGMPTLYYFVVNTANSCINTTCHN